jgi:soluble lytic murein transglycosylase-like protein
VKSPFAAPVRGSQSEFHKVLMSGVTGLIRTGNTARLCLLAVVAFNLQGGQSTAKPATADTPTLTQAERAEAAMQKSLAQQQASLDASRQNLDSGSLLQQRTSLQQQAAVLEGQDKGSSIPLGSQSPKQPDPLEAKQTNFFALPWPSPIPLAVPNVQMVDDSCQALGTRDVDQLTFEAGRKHGVDADLLRSVMRQESGFKPCAVSVAGAMGLMQIMPDTAEMLKLDDPFNPAKNVDAGASFLKMMLDRYQGNVPLALSAYNAGPGKVDKAGGVPPITETLQYITNILGSLRLAY